MAPTSIICRSAGEVERMTGSDGSAATVAKQLEELQDEMRLRHTESSALLDRVHPRHRQSAANLLDYLTLRAHDVRSLQRSLSELGLSSLGRSEEHVITSLERVLGALRFQSGRDDGRRTESAVGFGEGRTTLTSNATALLGPGRESRYTRIMVTMPAEAAGDIQLCRTLLANGMDCARINCAHDDPDRWARMLTNIRKAAAEAGRPCPVLMDLPGPKLRTGPIEAGPQVSRFRPRRDVFGEPVSPATAFLMPDDGTENPPPGRIPVPAGWLAGLNPGDRIRLRDTRQARRQLSVVEVEKGKVRVEIWDTTYLGTGTHLTGPGGATAIVGSLRHQEQALVLRPGDVLTLTGDPSPVSAASATIGRRPDDSAGARIGCTVPDALDALRIGHRVFFDDGRIGGSVVRLRPGEVDLDIFLASSTGSKLRAEKGINFPDSDFRHSALVPEDDGTLHFVVDHADLIGLSFAQSPEDIVALQRRLEQLTRRSLGIVLKIETVRGFEALPEMLLVAMESERIGVMVARGDLAVECGFERLAEVQEEILWLCDAAHVPVIWATQVLDQMARTGQPSRAEISDAAMAGRAECVMLNKGPHIARAVASLDDILGRMSSHQEKKVALLRRLSAWSHTPASPRPDL
jgi:pyruvate kinase